jgi:hypothetical protein
MVTDFFDSHFTALHDLEELLHLKHREVGNGVNFVLVRTYFQKEIIKIFLKPVKKLQIEFDSEMEKSSFYREAHPYGYRIRVYFFVSNNYM